MLKKITLALGLAVPSLASAWPYAILGGAVGSADLGSLEAGYGAGRSSDDSINRAVLGVGGEYSPNLGVEAVFLTEAEASVEDAAQRDAVATSGFQAAVLGKAPLTPQFTLFGKLSANYMRVSWDYTDKAAPINNASDEDSKLHLGYGLGLHYQASDAVGARLVLERIQMNDAINGQADLDIDQAVLALTFAF